MCRVTVLIHQPKMVGPRRIFPQQFEFYESFKRDIYESRKRKPIMFTTLIANNS